MGSDELLAAKLHRHIQAICTTLKGIGYESAVIVASSQDNHTKMGSKGGLQFIERFDLVTDFLWFCQDGGYFLQKTTLETTGPDSGGAKPILELNVIKVVQQPQSKLVHHSKPQTIPNPQGKLAQCPGSQMEQQLEIKQETQSEKELVPRTDVKLVTQPDIKLVPRVLTIRVPQPNVKPVNPQSVLVPRPLSKHPPHSDSKLTVSKDSEMVSCPEVPCRILKEVPHSLGSQEPQPLISQEPLSNNKVVPHLENSKDQHHDDKMAPCSEISQVPGCEIKEPDYEHVPPCPEVKIEQGTVIKQNLSLEHIREEVAVIQKLPSAHCEAAVCPVLFVSYNKGKQVTSRVKQLEIGQIPYTDSKNMSSSGKQPVQQTLESMSNATVSSKNDLCSNQNSMGAIKRRKKKLVRKTKKNRKNSYVPAKTTECECEQCNRKFSCTKYLKQHKSRCMKTLLKPFKCVHCEEAFISMNALIKHEVVHDDMNCKKCYKCDLCDREYPKIYNFKRHFQRTHPLQHSNKQTSYKYGTSQETFQCDQCNKTFYFAHALYTHHQKMHALEKLSLKCVNCDKEFKFITSLMRHEATVHKSMATRNYHYCNECGKKFVTFCSFYSHRRTFHNGIPYKPPEKCKPPPVLCTICGKTYHRYFLKKHIEQIHNSLTFTCKICSKSFKSASYLKIHQSIHTGAAGRYICDTCGFTTRYGPCLVRHKIRHHSKARPYKCEFCARSYCFLYDLLAHKRSHTGYQKAPSK